MGRLPDRARRTGIFPTLGRWAAAEARKTDRGSLKAALAAVILRNFLDLFRFRLLRLNRVPQG
jgi:hypothetical protein